MMLKVQVLLFANLKEELGWESADYAVTEAATPSDLIAAMGLDGPVLCAVNRAQVELTHPLSDGDEVALMPPMSGG